MKADQNDDGQPLSFLINKTARSERNYDELIGMIRGIVADGSSIRRKRNSSETGA